MVMAATEDKLMGVKLMEKVAAEYRNGIEKLSIHKKIEFVEVRGVRLPISKNVKQEVHTGVTMVVVQELDIMYRTMSRQMKLQKP